tara:strand:- start:139 stop:576 length:438 start_codon:yes stop_codon:yes gene_type:complete
MTFIVLMVVIFCWFIYHRSLNNRKKNQVKNSGFNKVAHNKYGNSKRKLTSKLKCSKYHCVEILSKKESCSSVIALTDKRFLPYEAPAIPLLECDYQSCSCHYAHHEDRRVAPRRDDYVLQYEIYKRTHQNPHQKRTTSKGRREND